MEAGGGGTVLLARWTSDWDCGEETNFWYVIKDSPFDISVLKSKRRYEINKGKKHFRVQRITPKGMPVEIFNVAQKAFSAYPKKYRPVLDREKFINEIITIWNNYSVFGAFNDKNILCGYACLIDYDDYTAFSVLKTDPAEEKNGINAALVYGILLDYHNRLSGGKFYICDGARAVRHQTHFQDYLEKYFDFRKAYCHLHIKYRWYVKLAISILKPFRKVLLHSENGILWNISSLIEMDELCEKQRND